MCWARRKKQQEEGEEQDRVTGQAVVLVQDNNEALLSLSLSLVFLFLSLSLLPHFACFRLSPLFATGCIAYFSPSSLQPATPLPLLALPLPVSLSASAASLSPFAHFHTHVLMLPLPVAQRAFSCCQAAAAVWHATGTASIGSIVTCILSWARFAFRLHFRLLIIANLTVYTPSPPSSSACLQWQ